MSIESVIQAVAANRSLWVELECPSFHYDLSTTLHLMPVTDPLHCTIVFFGKEHSADFVVGLHDFLTKIKPPMFESRLSGFARFRGNQKEGDPVVLLLSDARIRKLKDDITYAYPVKGDWDYTPHMTVARIPQDRTLVVPSQLEQPYKVLWEGLALCAGEERVSV